jgi:hypothetical protein
MNRWLLLLLLVLVGLKQQVTAQPVGKHITAVAVMTPGEVAQYEKFEVGLALDRAFTTGEIDGNPYEPEDVSVEARFISPRGQKQAVRYGFYYADFVIDNQYLPANDARYWQAKPTPQPWRIRFAPTEPGTWRYVLSVRYRDGTTETLPARSFACVASATQGFLKVSANRRNLIFDSGASFFAIGSNADYWSNTPIKVPPALSPLAPGTPNLSYCGPQASVPVLTPTWPALFSTYSYEAYDQAFREMQANGGNFSRVWLKEFNWDMETYDPATDTNTLGYYESHQNMLFDFDRLVESARAHHIYLQLSLLDANRLWNVDNKGVWQQFPYKLGLGLTKPLDFFTDPQARHFFKNRIRYVIARWGYGPNIMSYELVNEGDFTDLGRTFLQTYGPAGPDFAPLRAWTVEMARYVKALAPRQLQTLAYGPENVEGLLHDFPELFDYSTSHDYSSSFNAQVQRSFRAQSLTRLHHRPYQLQEFDYTPYINTANDVKFHVTPWATAFNGSFGIGLQLSAFAQLHHPCWPAYDNYQPLARFLADTHFSSTAPNEPIGNAAATATAIYGDYRAGLKVDPQLLTKIPPTANPAYSSACDRSCPPPFYGSTGVAVGGYQGSKTANLVEGISTSEDGLIEVFALKNPGQITGWVHNKTHYWFNVPHDHDGFCNTCYENPGLDSAHQQTITPLRGQQLTISHLKRRGTYTVQWFYPYPGTDVDGNGKPADGGFLPHLTVTLTATQGRLTLPIPPLVVLGTDGPTTAPDYGFVITEQLKKGASATQPPRRF